MAFDDHSNFGYSLIAVAPSPAGTGTSLEVSPGHGALFPSAPFNCTVWPAGAQPLASNAEIIRVTAVVGDTFTILRAQEGSNLIAIQAGMQIANTTSKLVFQDIEQSIIQFISAGTTKASASEVVFSNGNNVTFFAVGQSIFGSVAPPSGGGVAISAGGNSQSTGTVIFANANGITFGLDAFGSLTASHNGITQQSTQPVAASASNGSFTFGTLQFTDANGVTFGTSPGGIIFASVAAGAAPGSIAVAGSTLALGQAVFSNANGITFGMAGSTMTASHNGITSQSNQVLSLFAASNTTQSTSGTANASSIVFAGAGGVSVGISNGSVVISAQTANTAGGGAGIIFFEPRHAVSTGNIASVDAVLLTPFVLPASISLSFVRMAALMQTQSITNATIATNAWSLSNRKRVLFNVMIYSMGTGASSQSLQAVASNTVTMQFENYLSVTNSSQQTISQFLTYIYNGTTSLHSTSYATTVSRLELSTTAFANFTGSRMLDIGLPCSLSAGNYWYGVRMVGSSSGDSVFGPPLCFVVPNSLMQINGPSDAFALMGSAISQNFMFAGSASSGAGVTSASYNTSNITIGGSNRINWIELHAQGL
jgi:hypothetical protein